MTEPVVESSAPVRGSTQTAGTVVDEGKGRTFPCEGCGADLTFHIGQQKLKCPFCGYEKDIEIAAEAQIVEQDFESILAKVRALQEKKRRADSERHPKQSADGSPVEEAEDEVDEAQQKHEIRCGGCGATVEFLGSLTSSACPYCDTPLQRENVHDAADRIPADGVLPFLVDHKTAKGNLAAWVRSRWFAPTEFRKRGVDGKFTGTYLPYWTFDSMTATWYRGERGRHYYVTVQHGKETKQERRTDWTPVSGSFQRFFDDVLVLAVSGLPKKVVQELEPWPLEKCVPFNQQMLAGHFARTYETGLEPGFHEARQRIDAAIADEVRKRIGGDEQRVHSIKSSYDAVTFKHLLLPLWLLAYRFHEKAYQVFVNAATGEVQGERPWSWVKITFATALGIATAVGLYFLFRK